MSPASPTNHLLARMLAQFVVLSTIPCTACQGSFVPSPSDGGTDDPDDDPDSDASDTGNGVGTGNGVDTEDDGTQSGEGSEDASGEDDDSGATTSDEGGEDGTTDEDEPSQELSLVWSKNFGEAHYLESEKMALDLVAVEDGGVALSGTWKNPTGEGLPGTPGIAAFDHSGTLQWDTNLCEEEGEAFAGLRGAMLSHHPPSGEIIIGADSTTTMGQGKLIRLGSDGSYSWSVDLYLDPEQTQPAMPVRVEFLADDSIRVLSSQFEKLPVARHVFDPSGSLLASKTYEHGDWAGDWIGISYADSLGRLHHAREQGTYPSSFWVGILEQDNELDWKAEYEADDLGALLEFQIDSYGNSYLLVEEVFEDQSSPFSLHKYDPNGSPAWSRRPKDFDIPAIVRETPHAMALFPSGEILLMGDRDGTLYFRVITSKGESTSLVEHDLGQSRGDCLLLDEKQNVFVAGTNPSNEQGWLAKFK